MKRIIILVLTLAILFISVFDKYSLPVNASDGTTEEETVAADAYCATANALMWEMLQTYLYGIAGQQAYDTYANDPQAQANLYADFCDWVETQKWLAQVEFTAVLYGGSVAVRNGQDVINYYKTAGSSALADVQEEAYKGWTVIKGGLNENNEEPQISPTSIPTTDSKGNRIARIAGMGTLIGCIGGYIKDLVNGERGEISDTFNGVAGIPDYFFNGQYGFDEEGFPIFDIKADCYVPARLAKDSVYIKKEDSELTWSYRNANYDYNSEDKMALCCYNTGQVRENADSEFKDFYYLYFYKYDDSKTFQSNLTNTFYRLYDNNWVTSGYSGLAVEAEEAINISYMPVFLTYEDMEYFFETGDCSKAINYFDGEVVKPSSWLDYQMANIAQQLQQILQAFTNLPTITTDDLAGFATSISQGLAANTANIQAMTQEQLQQFMANLNMDSAKNVAMGELTEYSPYTGAGDGETVVTPKPTLEPYKEYQRDNARMMVDLSQFFPFCIPYDLVHLIKVLNAEPVAPKFETTIKYAKLGINEKITLDLSSFNDVAKIFRTCEILLFILGLILLTRNIIRG